MTKTILINASYAPSLVNFRGPLIREMVRRGYEVHATAPEVDLGTKTAIEALGAHIHQVALSRTGLDLSGQVRYFKDLRSLMKEIKPDLVIGYTIKPNVFGTLAAQTAGIQSVSMITGLGFAFSGQGTMRQRLAMWLSRRLYSRATRYNYRVIFQNPDDLNDMVSAGCLSDTAKARIVNGSGVDLNHYRPCTLPDRPVFLMIARLLVAKGVREYASASIHLKRRFPSWRFLLAGFLDEGPDGIAASELEEWQRQGIEFLGELQDVRPAMKTASVYVLPSYREGTPRSVLEAMAIGRPIVTTRAPGCRETVVENANGFLVPVGDHVALIDAMQRLGKDSELRSSFGSASLKIAREKYAVESVNEALLGHMAL